MLRLSVVQRIGSPMIPVALAASLLPFYILKRLMVLR